MPALKLPKSKRPSALGFAACKAFAEEIDRIVRALGGELVSQNGWRISGVRHLRTSWKMLTRGGMLEIDVFGSDVGTLTVFSRFANPTRAAALVPCNPHSGKWNAHLGHASEISPADAAALWRERYALRVAVRSATEGPCGMCGAKVWDVVDDLIGDGLVRTTCCQCH